MHHLSFLRACLETRGHFWIHECPELTEFCNDYNVDVELLAVNNAEALSRVEEVSAGRKDYFVGWKILLCSYWFRMDSIIQETRDLNSLASLKTIADAMKVFDGFMPPKLQFEGLFSQTLLVIDDSRQQIEQMIRSRMFGPQLRDALALLGNEGCTVYKIMLAEMMGTMVNSVIPELQHILSKPSSRNLWRDLAKLHMAESYLKPYILDHDDAIERVVIELDNRCECAEDLLTDFERKYDRFEFAEAEKMRMNCNRVVNCIEDSEILGDHNSSSDSGGVEPKLKSNILTKGIRKLTEKLGEFLEKSLEKEKKWFEAVISTGCKQIAGSNDFDLVKFHFPKIPLLKGLKASSSYRGCDKFTEHYENVCNGGKEVVNSILDKISLSIAGLPSDKNEHLPSLAECARFMDLFDDTFLPEEIRFDPQIRPRISMIKDDIKFKQEDNQMKLDLNHASNDARDAINSYFYFCKSNDRRAMTSSQRTIQKHFSETLDHINDLSKPLQDNILTMEGSVASWWEYSEKVNDKDIKFDLLIGGLEKKIKNILSLNIGDYVKDRSKSADLLCFLRLFPNPASPAVDTQVNTLVGHLCKFTDNRIEKAAIDKVKNITWHMQHWTECVDKAIANVIKPALTCTILDGPRLSWSESKRVFDDAVQVIVYFETCDAIFGELKIFSENSACSSLADPIKNFFEKINSSDSDEDEESMKPASFAKGDDDNSDGDSGGEEECKGSGMPPQKGSLNSGISESLSPFQVLCRRFKRAISCCDREVLSPPSYFEAVKSINATDRDKFYSMLNACFYIRMLADSRARKSSVVQVCIPRTDKYLSKYIEEQIDDMIETVESALTGVFVDRNEPYSRVDKSDSSAEVFNLAVDHLRSISSCFVNPYGKGVSARADKALSIVSVKFSEKLDQYGKKLWIHNSLFQNESAAKLMSEVGQIGTRLIAMKKLTQSVDMYKDAINNKIDDAFEYYEKHGESGMAFIVRIGAHLSALGPWGPLIISDHPALKAYSDYLGNERFSRMTVDDMLNPRIVVSEDGVQKELPCLLRGDDLNVEDLRDNYHEVWSKYKQLYEPGLNLDTQESHILSLTDRAINLGKQLKNRRANEKLLELISVIFATWTVTTSSNYNKVSSIQINRSTTTFSNLELFLTRPHVGQVLTILRLFGFGSKKKRTDKSVFQTLWSVFDWSSNLPGVTVDNQFVQLSTGEGKSVILAVASIVLALCGYRVDCACYSDYLSRRDFDAFRFLFQKFRVEKHISYGTFNQLCENMLNRMCDIRQTVCEMVTIGKASSVRKADQISSRPPILIIDEVDVFFSEDFYGRPYIPLAQIKSNEISKLLKFVWKLSKDYNLASVNSKERNEIFNKIVGSQEYKSCMVEPAVLNECVKKMVGDLVAYDHEYKFQDNCIYYKEGDSLTDKIFVGYKTVFAYFKHHESQEISQDKLESMLSLLVDCGAFAYAEIPKLYISVLGVTGTLETLSAPEKRVLRDEYRVSKITIMPSVYGERSDLLKFSGNSSEDLQIYPSDTYFGKIVDEINRRCLRNDAQRPILVFFENVEKLESFRSCQKFRPLRDATLLLTEETLNRDDVVAKTMNKGQVTLLTQELGRGTDFKCLDDELNNAGGVHVLQTFVCEDLSAETQIQGRTARQGHDGSYSMILLDTELEKFGINQEEIADMKSKKEMYNVIDEKRRDTFDGLYATRTQYVALNAQNHVISQEFLEYLKAQNKGRVIDFLVQRNKSQGVGGVYSRTVCLIDGTGSMTGTLEAVKATVMKMFSDVELTLNAKGVSGSFELLIGIYRNYNAPPEKLFEHSSWESEPPNLEQFMKGVRPEYGWGNEAVEVGLQFVNNNTSVGNITQVILIGDMPPNSPADVINKRDSHDFNGTAFELATTSDEEIQKLRQKGIKVFAYYVCNAARSSFENMARMTGGECRDLDVRTTGAKKLKEAVVKRVLFDIGRNEGDGTKSNELVRQYEEMVRLGHV
mmetsp:Transcript_1307/g.2561  ORF Transcript_1307/g.2561 Transcript_1307/m.2561 type:complete len:1973 (-) Transcript_1307:280-6198(-)